MVCTIYEQCSVIDHEYQQNVMYVCLLGVDTTLSPSLTYILHVFFIHLGIISMCTISVCSSCLSTSNATMDRCILSHKTHTVLGCVSHFTLFIQKCTHLLSISSYAYRSYSHVLLRTTKVAATTGENILIVDVTTSFRRCD